MQFQSWSSLILAGEIRPDKVYKMKYRATQSGEEGTLKNFMIVFSWDGLVQLLPLFQIMRVDRRDFMPHCHGKCRSNFSHHSPHFCTNTLSTLCTDPPMLKIHCGGDDWGEMPRDCDWRETKWNNCGSHCWSICPRTWHTTLGAWSSANTNWWIVWHERDKVFHSLKECKTNSMHNAVQRHKWQRCLWPTAKMTQWVIVMTVQHHWQQRPLQQANNNMNTMTQWSIHKMEIENEDASVHKRIGVGFWSIWASFFAHLNDNFGKHNSSANCQHLCRQLDQIIEECMGKAKIFLLKVRQVKWEKILVCQMSNLMSIVSKSNDKIFCCMELHDSWNFSSHLTSHIFIPNFFLPKSQQLKMRQKQFLAVMAKFVMWVFCFFTCCFWGVCVICGGAVCTGCFGSSRNCENNDNQNAQNRWCGRGSSSTEQKEEREHFNLHSRDRDKCTSVEWGFAAPLSMDWMDLVFTLILLLQEPLLSRFTQFIRPDWLDHHRFNGGILFRLVLWLAWCLSQKIWLSGWAFCANCCNWEHSWIEGCSTEQLKPSLLLHR